MYCVTYSAQIAKFYDLTSTFEHAQSKLYTTYLGVMNRHSRNYRAHSHYQARYLNSSVFRSPNLRAASRQKFLIKDQSYALLYCMQLCPQLATSTSTFVALV